MRQRSLQILEKETRVTSRVTAVDPVALREDDTRYRELVDHLHSAVVVYEAAAGGEDFIIRDFNPAAARLEQTIPQAVIGRPVTEAFPRRCGVRPPRCPAARLQDGQGEAPPDRALPG
jgi:hypothetical protein